MLFAYIKLGWCVAFLDFEKKCVYIQIIIRNFVFDFTMLLASKIVSAICPGDLLIQFSSLALIFLDAYDFLATVHGCFLGDSLLRRHGY